MDTVISRRRASFNLRKDVLDILRQNETTHAAIMEAKQGDKNPKEIYSNINDLINDLMAV